MVYEISIWKPTSWLNTHYIDWPVVSTFMQIMYREYYVLMFLQTEFEDSLELLCGFVRRQLRRATMEKFEVEREASHPPVPVPYLFLTPKVMHPPLCVLIVIRCVLWCESTFEQLLWSIISDHLQFVCIIFPLPYKSL